jgi:hypothetical protein
MNKKLTMVAACIMASFNCSLALADAYCDGWDAGYEAGACYQKFGCIAPITPICPIPKLSEDDGYQGGYNRGFLAGLHRES